MGRKDKVLEYIDGHFGCTKTSLENGVVGMAPRTVRKYLKELIEEDKKVVCIVDKVNPRIHHLFINDQIKLMKMDLAMSKVEAQMKKEKYTILGMGSGGYALTAHSGGTIIHSSVRESIDNIITTASRLKSVL